MGKGLKKKNFWVRRKSSIPFILIGSLIVVVLFMNEETSVKTNMEYEKQIYALKNEIQQNNDSANYYREHRLAIENGKDELEHIAREQYHFKRPTEDVFIYDDTKK